MKNKKSSPEESNQIRNHNLQAVRQHLRNKLIEVGLDCNQIKEQYHSKRKADKKGGSLYQQNKNLPLIFSLKNSLTMSRDDNVKFAQEIFTHRQRLIESQTTSPKHINQYQKVKQRQSLSFRQQFQRKMIEQVKLYKMEKIFPNLRRSLRKEKLKTQANQTIVIRAINHHKQTEVVYVSPRGKLKNIRSKTEQHKPQESPPQIKIARTTQYKQLSPWDQTNQKDNWLQNF